ncbi:MAG TPA: hypothetical protein HPQ04_00705 [Rhodospirillaceae bacterium]|nr:hypothetical protein [Rhodospirillaceae bacterium]
MSRQWSSSEARANFSNLLNDAAVGQIIQIERQSDGAEFVLVSKELFLSSRPSLAQYLADLDTGLGEDDSEQWLQAMRDAQGK